VFALGLVHQQLMGSADLKTFDIGPFLAKLAANVIGAAADDRIRMTVDACPLKVGLDFAVPLGMVVTEIVTNSLKHAFPEGAGEVAVTLRPGAGDRVVLTVADNGRGQAVAPAGPERTGLGSSIVRKLVAQLAGEMNVRYEFGTITEISVPLPETA
jgi:two-component sensor histidine kinase